MLASAAIHPGLVSLCSCLRAGNERRCGERRTGDLLEDFLGDIGGDLVLGDSIWVRQSVVYNMG